MNATQLRAFRDRLNVTQATMGKLIGLSLRGYTKLETGEQGLRKMHVMAIERLMIWAVAQDLMDEAQLSVSVRRDLARMRGE